MAKTGLKKELGFSDVLKAITGHSKGARTKATKWIWDYIKKHELQDPTNGRNIIADEKFLKFSKKKKISMFDIARLLSDHLHEI